MIIIPILAGIFWIVQAFIDKELMKDISIETLIFIKVGFVLIILAILSYIFNPQVFSIISQDFQKIINKNELIKYLIFAALASTASLYIHSLGYKKFKISKFVSVETIFSIIISVLVGYFFFQEKLDKYECFGVFMGIISIMIFYYKDLLRIFNI